MKIEFEISLHNRIQYLSEIYAAYKIEEIKELDLKFVKTHTVNLCRMIQRQIGDVVVTCLLLEGNLLKGIDNKTVRR